MTSPQLCLRLAFSLALPSSRVSFPCSLLPLRLQGTLDLLEAPEEKLATTRVYNLTALSFTPAQLADSIRKYIPGFAITYKPDFRQQIADSWPASIDDSVARNEWGWRHDFDLDAMTRDMLKSLAPRLGVPVPESLRGEK